MKYELTGTPRTVILRKIATKIVVLYLKKNAIKNPKFEKGSIMHIITVMGRQKHLRRRDGYEKPWKLKTLELNFGVTPRSRNNLTWK